DRAGAHWGAGAPIHAAGGARAGTGPVKAGRASVGGLPAPADSDPDPWWRCLAANPDSLHVVVKLPFLAAGGASAFVVAAFAPEPSGDDRTLVAIESGDRAKALADAGLKPVVIARARRWQLAALEGFVAPRDRRLGDA